MTQELVRIAEVSRRLGIGKSTAWTWVKQGRLPQPAARIGQRVTLWSWDAVLDHIGYNASQRAIAGRRHKQTACKIDMTSFPQAKGASNARVYDVQEINEWLKANSIDSGGIPEVKRLGFGQFYNAEELDAWIMRKTGQEIN